MAEKEKTGYELVQIPTEHQLAVQTPDEKVISINELIVKIANDVSEIKESVAD